jgi:uncharacterized protein YjbJ (UPF0337 family)
MNQDQAKGKFEQLKGKLKETWGRLSDDDIALYNGKREQFLGKVRETYGTAQAEAENQLKKLEDAHDKTMSSRAA